MRLKPLLVLFFVCSVLVLTSLDALACSCGAKPSVLAAYERADVVVSGRLVSVEKVPPDGEENRYYDGIRSATLVVEKVYKGNLRVRDEVKLGQGNGDCSWTFTEGIVGQQFLFYLPRTPDGEFWSVSSCGRSHYLENATEDLLYLDNINKLRGKTRVSGHYGYGRPAGFELANKKIVIRGEKETYETITDEHGVFEVYDLPAGKYVLEPELQNGSKLSDYQVWNSNVSRQPSSTRSLTFTLEPKEHVTIDLRLAPANGIEGNIVGPQGDPLANVCVALLSKDNKGPNQLAGCSDKTGHFRAKDVLAGSYYVVVNLQDEISVNEPYRRLFYPNVTQIEKAAAITVSEGETVTGINLVIPKVEETLTITGVLQFSDGKPVSDDDIATLSFKAAPREGFKTDEIEFPDDHGRFTFKILKGLKGELAGVFAAQIGEYANCPKLDALLMTQGYGAASLKSSVIAIDGDRDVENVVLRFPFPKCKRKEIDPR